MGGKYEKGIYNQLMEVMETECKKYREEIKSLNSEVKILNNNSSNTSIPPSADKSLKAPNTYNSRKPTKKKVGAQPRHKGNNISKADVEKKIHDGLVEHKIKDIGNSQNAYITRYRLENKIKKQKVR